MKSAFTNSFLRDVRKLPDDEIREQVRGVILAVEASSDLRDVANVKKLSGRGSSFRIRVGNYRIGMTVEGGTAIFVRVLPRRDIYRFFP
ncbi:MAG TPA: type II toxin-antitoxin system RelE/ParE family toxin [Longimicrobiaceae bacterium]|jgi:mRNA interferase RelE/StbE|nr:type II toxin-antitoxin system RelE/ParE family toxin [Longimicrobiaceae bacterium]